MTNKIFYYTLKNSGEYKRKKVCFFKYICVLGKYISLKIFVLRVGKYIWKKALSKCIWKKLGEYTAKLLDFSNILPDCTLYLKGLEPQQQNISLWLCFVITPLWFSLCKILTLMSSERHKPKQQESLHFGILKVQEIDAAQGRYSG